MSEGSGEPVITAQTFLSSSFSSPDDFEVFINSLMTEDVIRDSGKGFYFLFFFKLGINAQSAGRREGSWMEQLRTAKWRAPFTILELEIWLMSIEIENR